MSNPILSSKKMERLRRKMDNLNGIIEKLLSAHPRPFKSLHEHIAKLESLVGKMSDDLNSTRLDQYREQVVRFWQQFEFIGVESQSSQQPSENQMEFFNVCAPSFSTNLDRKIHSNGNPVTPGLSIGSSPPTADMIRTIIKKAFDQLHPVKSVETDLDGMKQLLMLVTKARALCITHWKNVALLSDIFTFAFSKLPLVQQVN